MDTRSARRRRGRGEDGFTLVEQLVTVVLLGLGASAVAAAILVMVGVSSRHRDLSEAAATVASAAELVASADTAWEPCATPGAYAAALAAAPRPASAPAPVVTAVRYWDGRGFAAGCQEAAGFTTQLLTVQVTNGAAHEEVDIVKHKPSGEVTP